jgi:hypothetical protein
MRRWRDGALLVQGVWVALTFGLLAATWHDAQGEPLLMRLSAIGFVVHAIWAFWSWRHIAQRWFDGYIVFLAALVAFSGGQIALYAGGVMPQEQLLGGKFGAGTTQRTLTLVGVAVSAFHFGALLAASRVLPVQGVRRDVTGAVRVLRTIGLACLVVGLPAYAYKLANSVVLVATRGYMALYQQEVRIGLENWVGVLASFFLPGVLMYFASSAKHPRVVRVSWAFSIAAILANLFMGARAYAFLHLFPMMMIHHALVAPLRKRVLATIAAGSIALIPAIAQFRGLSLQGRIEAAAVGAERQDSALVATLKETGGTLITVAHTIELFPEVRPFDFGMGYVRAASAAIPNIFGELHPVAREMTYSQWLMWKEEPVLFELGGGMGFSMIAEAFANYSWWGTPAVMCLWGALLVTLIARARARQDALGVALEAALLAAILILPRSETATVTRSITWFVLMPWVISTWGERRSGSG